MPAFNFMPQFAKAIKSGEKTTTFRQTLRAVEGDELQFYTGLRTKRAKKIGHGTCIEILKTYMSEESILFENIENENDSREIEDLDLLDEVARLDGFNDWRDMKEFFRDLYKLPCILYRYKWRIPDVQTTAG